MKALWIILCKEFRDNLRDRRSLFFTLLYGPLLLPALMIGPLVFEVNRHSTDVEQPRSIAVAGRDRAPNLVSYLASQNLDAEAVGDEFIDELRTERRSLVLEVPEEYGERWRRGDPAPLTIHYHSGEKDADQLRQRLRGVLERYHQRQRSLRFLARGIDEQLFEPLTISERDVSAQAPGEAFIGLMLPFLLLFSMMMGGFYLAVDSTAGERERQSLEPLLALPVSRTLLALGKYIAALGFVVVSLVLPLVTAFVLFGFLEEGGFASQYDFSASTFVLAGLLHLPVAFLLTALLFVIAVFARSTKEAQTQLGLAMMVPMLPFFLLQFADIPQHPGTAALPLLGQYQLTEGLVQGAGVTLAAVVLSATATLALALSLVSVMVWRYHREALLR